MTGARPLAYVRVESGRTLGFRPGCRHPDCVPEGDKAYVWVGEFFEAWFDAKMESVLHNLERHVSPYVVRESTEPSLTEHVNGGQHRRS